MPRAPETGARILVVEDDEAIRMVEERLLAREGHQLTLVSTAPEALEAVQNQEFDLILLDQELKGPLNGVAVCRTLKQQPRFARIPIMFVTGQIKPEALAEVFEAGADEFIGKPFPPDELITRCRVLIKRGREDRWLVERARKLAEKVAERDDELDDLRRFAQDIVGSLPSALMVLDANGLILFVNEPLLGLLGAERGAILGQRIEQIVRTECMQGIFAESLVRAVKEGHTSQQRRIADFLASQHDRYSDVTVCPLEYAGLRQILVVVEDVTEQARADAAVARERAKLNDIVNAMNAALCLIDQNRHILWKNRTFDLWFGESYGQPGLHAFCSKLTEDDSWVEPVFGKGLVRQLAWNVFTIQGQRRHFSNIIAPIKVESGQPVTQSLVLTQDVTTQETRVEQLSLLRELSQVLQHTLDTDRLNNVILLCVTAGHALGFNRAFLFKFDPHSRTLCPEMAVGPTSQEEAHRIWADLSNRGYTLREHLRDLEQTLPPKHSPLLQQIKHLRYSLFDQDEILVRTALERKPQVVTDARHDSRVTDAFRQTFGTHEFVAVPMIAKDALVGVIMADNLFSGRPFTDEHVKLLSLFAVQAAMAIANADTYAELQMRMRQLREAQDQLVHSEKLAAVGKMAAHVAHEIRNPLSTMGGFARAIAKRPDHLERVKRNATIIVEEATRLENLLKGVMDFSRPVPPSFKLGRLNATVEKAFQTNAEVFKKAGVVPTLDLDPALPDCVYDENQILQAIHNLVRNSIESMTKGGVLELRTAQAPEGVLLAVRDSGMGIPADLRKRIFNPFVTSKTEGTGLGLAVTKKIVDDHGGRIYCESEEGKGSTFFIQLPLSPPSFVRAAAPAARQGNPGP